MLLYDYYYRHFGVRRVMQLVSPILHGIETLDLPRDSVLHYVGEDDVVYGIAGDDYILRHTTRTILVDYELHLKSTLGNPRGTFQSSSKMIRDYQRKYRRFRQVKDIQTVWRDGRNLLIVDYAMLNQLYRYVKSLYSSYYRWYNIQATMWKTIGELVDQTDRHHYIQCTLPTVLPSVSLLNRGETNMSRTVLQALSDPSSLFILEIWKWLGKHRDTSMLAHLSDAQLTKIDLIWKESGRWMVINLGLLNSWRKPITEVEEPLNDEDEETSSAVTGTVSAMQLQRRFLRLLMFLFEQRTLMGAGKPQDASLNDNITQKSDETGEGKNVVTAVKEVPAKIVNPTIRPLMEGHEIPDIDDPEFDRIIDAAVKADLDALEHIEVPLEFDEEIDGVPVPPIAIVEYEPKNYSLEESIMAKTDQLADAGLLSGAEYRRMTTLSLAYKKLPDPYGKHESLEAQAHIDPKSILIPNKAQIPDIATVFDKSMLKSSLFHFDSHYINEIMPKDISNVVLSVHNAGVAVTGYHVETVEDALNHYDIHTLRLTPVHGNPSTIRFRLPKVQPDGTYLANGVRYRMAKQRGDVPIRKISPNRVALTSYYSKLFVERSEKSVSNYPQWLCNQIMAMGIDADNPKITDLKVSDVFDPALHLPRLYSMLGMRFKSFSLNGASWYFDYATRKEHFNNARTGDDLVARAEKNGMVMIGLVTVRSSANTLQPILVDKDNTLYQLVGDELKVLGSIEQLLDLDSSKAPVEQIDIRVFGKNIPVGFFLAYQLGLTGLFSLLKVNPRRVLQGERVNLNDDEYSIVFADETLVFQRENRLAAMYLSGFRMFANKMRDYSVHSFDKKDIYFNLLDSVGLNIRYLREMDLIVDMFVDPITKEILVQMKEPTDVIGLLLRSGELLMSDWSPDEIDTAYMRFKGYERMAGAVYAELVKAVRTHQARRGNTGNVVEMPPYVVWNAVQQDPSIRLVEESNPIHNLKEKEEVTYSGTGGRSRRSMVKNTRKFHQNDMGVISEATKDSSDVAVTTFLTADPGLTDIRGLTRRWEGDTTAATLMSTSALLAPCADRDD